MSIHTDKLTKVLLLFIAVVTFASCNTKHTQPFTPEQRQTTDSIVKSARSLTAIDSIYQKMEAEDNTLGKIVALREWGKKLRNESSFDEALQKHGEGLRLCESIGDTLEWVQALNNIGTDYRRMGILDAAQQYHLSALQMAEECSDTSFVAKKNRVVSLNGIANVYLTINNLEKADSTLRLALKGESELNSRTGQAINYANLGSIYESRGMIDSAWAYYGKSMQLNREDENSLGIALCHTYFGNLYKNDKEYDKALAEYEAAYELMDESKDDWHSLNALTALAGIYIEKGNDSQAEKYLAEAKETATRIHSIEHLASIYSLYHKMLKQRGDWRGALDAHERSAELHDSIIDMEKVNRMQSTSFNIERGQQSRRMTAANDKLESERSTRYIGYVVFSIIAVLLIGIIFLLIHAHRLRVRNHEALKKLNAMRESFFTNITHEFRTPLTVILGLGQDLQSSAPKADEATAIGSTIERQGTRMLHLINQLLDISKIRSAIGVPDWRNGNIIAYISMIVETFEEYAKKRGIKLQFIARDKDIETDFVPDYISKVVNNLLSNALKFTPEYGRIDIDIQHTGDKYSLEITNTGRGIPAENLPHIFEAFYQCENAGDKTGSGVGLALVQQIVKTLEGTITVDSVEGKETTFRILLPIRHNTATPAFEEVTVNDVEQYTGELDEISIPESDKEQTPHSDNGTTILIVEDNADVASFINKRLEGKYNTLFATDGKQGLAIAKEKLPDIIITDLMMPHMDGLQLTRSIRSDFLTCHIPIIVVTAKVTEQDRIKGLKAGADAYLTKPFNSDELLTRINKLLEQRQILRKKFTQDNIIGTKQQPAASTTDNNQEEKQPTAIDLRFINRLTDSIYLLLNAGKQVDVNAVAERMNMSYSQLYRKLSAITGLTPVQYIQRVKVSKAKRMLGSHPEMNLNAIAEQCGFSDYSNFVRAFKNVLDQTPTQYIRNISKETPDD